MTEIKYIVDADEITFEDLVNNFILLVQTSGGTILNIQFCSVQNKFAAQILYMN